MHPTILLYLTKFKKVMMETTLLCYIIPRNKQVITIMTYTLRTEILTISNKRLNTVHSKSNHFM